MKTVAESGLENVEVVLGEFNMVLPSEVLKQLIL
jgi:hypothetical protein